MGMNPKLIFPVPKPVPASCSYDEYLRLVRKETVSNREIGAGQAFMEVLSWVHKRLHDDLSGTGLDPTVYDHPEVLNPFLTYCERVWND